MGRKRPHIRHAHDRHYWTGSIKKNTKKLELRHISDIKVEGGAMEEKRNNELTFYEDNIKQSDLEKKHPERSLKFLEVRNKYGVFCYKLMPIDFWTEWKRPEDIYIHCYEKEYMNSMNDRLSWEKDFAPIITKGMKAARELGWEGDIREGPYICFIPRYEIDNMFMFPVIAWKQDNNGITFIISETDLGYGFFSACIENIDI